MPFFRSSNSSRHLRMAQRLVRGVGHEVLLRHIGDVLGVGVLREQMIEGLILVGSDVLGNGAVPLLGIAEGRVDVEDHAAKRVDPVADHLADLEFGAADGRHYGTLFPEFFSR